MTAMDRRLRSLASVSAATASRSVDGRGRLLLRRLLRRGAGMQPLEGHQRKQEWLKDAPAAEIGDRGARIAHQVVRSHDGQDLRQIVRREVADQKRASLLQLEQ